MAALDWSLFHFLNGLLRGDDPAQDVVEQFTSASVPAFAVATCLLWFFARPSRRIGALFLLAAVLIGVSRILMGLHYPGDVAAGAAVGLFSAMVVTRLARRPIELIVRQLSRLSDPLVATGTRRMAAAWRRPRHLAGLTASGKYQD